MQMQAYPSGLNKIISSILLITLSFFLSCTYDTDEIYIRKVIKNPDAPEIGILDPILLTDTIFVYGSYKIFDLNFRSSNQEIIGVNFTIDDSVSMFVRSDNGKVHYDPGFLTQGSHTLKLDLITHSGSSSIADLLEIEGYVFSSTWILMVVHEYYTYLEEGIVNGYLRITFPQYRNTDLKEYEISRFAGEGYTVIGGVSSPEFTDSTYSGESASYKVVVHTVSGDVLSWGEGYFNRNLPVSGLYISQENEYYIAWNKSKYYNAVDKYYTEISTPYSQEVSSKYFDAPDDTILFMPDLQHGETILFKLRVIPKEGNIVFETGSNNHLFGTSQYMTAGL